MRGLGSRQKKIRLYGAVVASRGSVNCITVAVCNRCVATRQNTDTELVAHCCHRVQWYSGTGVRYGCIIMLYNVI